MSYQSTLTSSRHTLTCTLTPLASPPQPTKKYYAYSWGEEKRWSDDERGIGERMAGVLGRIGGEEVLVEFEVEGGKAFLEDSIGIRLYKFSQTLTKEVLTTYLTETQPIYETDSLNQPSSLESYSVGSLSLRKKVLGNEEEKKDDSNKSTRQTLHIPTSTINPTELNSPTQRSKLGRPNNFRTRTPRKNDREVPDDFVGTLRSRVKTSRTDTSDLQSRGSRGGQTPFAIESWDSGNYTPQNDFTAEEQGLEGVTLEDYNPTSLEPIEFCLTKEDRIELKGLRNVSEVVYDIFKMVFSLFNDQGSRNVSWYDCRDFCVNFKEGVLVQSRISGVVRQVKGMEGGEVRRVSRIAAEVLEWVGEVVGFKGGGGGKKNNIGFELG